MKTSIKKIQDKINAKEKEGSWNFCTFNKAEFTRDEWNFNNMRPVKEYFRSKGHEISSFIDWFSVGKK